MALVRWMSRNETVTVKFVGPDAEELASFLVNSLHAAGELAFMRFSPGEPVPKAAGRGSMTTGDW